MTPEDVLNILREIGSMLEPTAQRAWDIAMRQVIVEMIASTVWFSPSVVVLFLSARLISGGLKRWKDSTRSWVDDGSERIVAGGLLGITSCIFAVDSLVKVVSRLINPEWYVIQMLLSVVK
jgi:hypothetical protein